MVPFELDSIGRFANANSNYPWLETTAITVLFFGIGVWTHPEDPLLTLGAFPWSIFAIILIAMRYGSSEAFAAAVALHIAAAAHAEFTSAGLWPLPLSFSLGILTCSLLIGEIRDNWEQKTEQLERSNEYRQARLEEFTHSYHVLKISHDALEQEHAGKRNSLRSALLNARAKLSTADPEDVGELLLNLLSTYIAARGASYHKVTGTQINADPDAILGKAEPLDAADTMLQRAVATLATVSVKPEDTQSLGSREPGSPVVIIPVVDAYQRLHGLVAITQIPFFSLTEKNLQLASIIASRFADCLKANERVSPSELTTLTDRASDALYWFVYQTLRCLDQAQNFGIESHLLLHQFGKPDDADELVETVEGQTRGLDHTLSWRDPDGRLHLLMLLPLTNPDGANRFMQRFNGYIESNHGIDLLEAEISTHRLHVQTDSNIESITRFYDRFLGAHNQVSEALRVVPGQTDSQGSNPQVMGEPGVLRSSA